MNVLIGIFILIMSGIIAGTITEIFKASAKRAAISPAELEELKQLVRDQTAALADTEARLSAQSEMIDEMQERLNFTERMLTQFRDRPAIGPGPHGG